MDLFSWCSCGRYQWLCGYPYLFEIIREKIHALFLDLCLDSSCCIADKQDFCLVMRKYIAGIS